MVLNLGYAYPYVREYVKLGEKYYLVINTEKSGPDLGLATGDPDVRTVD
jgi:hypothetical protein